MGYKLSFTKRTVVNDEEKLNLEYFNRNISYTPLPKRLVYLLNQNQIYTLGELLEARKISVKLLTIKGIGRKFMTLIDDILEKYKLSVGDTLALKDEYSDDTYEFEILGTYPYPASFTVFISSSRFEELFDKEEGYFNG